MDGGYRFPLWPPYPPPKEISVTTLKEVVPDNMQKRASKDAHLYHNVVTRVKINYFFHMLSYDYAEMKNF